VYCVAGLVRSPVLFVLALIEGGTKYVNLVQYKIKSGGELLTTRNFCIWRSIILKCGCFKNSNVMETTVAFNKAGVPDAIALEVELEMRPNSSYILTSRLAW
jgi:hypothetical protein